MRFLSNSFSLYLGFVYTDKMLFTIPRLHSLTEDFSWYSKSVMWENASWWFEILSFESSITFKLPTYNNIYCYLLKNILLKFSPSLTFFKIWIISKSAKYYIFAFLYNRFSLEAFFKDLILLQVILCSKLINGPK